MSTQYLRISAPLWWIFLISIIAVLALLSVCCFRNDSSVEQITYSDKNGDGRIDAELHHFTNWHDADWALMDTDFNGRYDKRVSYSIGPSSESVDMPVPNEWETGIPKVVVARPDGATKR